MSHSRSDRYIRRLFSATALSLLVAVLPTGCSMMDHGGEAPLTEQDRALLATPLVLDVFTARGFLGGSDYEHYKIEGDLLWRECGNILGSSAARGRMAGEASSKSDSDPNISRLQSRVENVGKPQLLELKRKVSEALGEIEEDSQQTLPLPGSVFALSGPGLIELQLSFGNDRRHFITSVDAVAEPESEPLTAVSELLSAVRAVGPVICNAPTFYGIRRDRGVERLADNR